MFGRVKFSENYITKYFKDAGTKCTDSVSKESQISLEENMNYKSNLKILWSVVAFISLVLLALTWFGYESANLKNSILALNVMMFLLSLPCSIFAVPVVAAAAYYLEMPPTSAEGIYVSTIFLSVLGAVQWFWIMRFWSPTEPIMQKLDLIAEK